MSLTVVLLRRRFVKLVKLDREEMSLIVVLLLRRSSVKLVKLDKGDMSSMLFLLRFSVVKLVAYSSPARLVMLRLFAVSALNLDTISERFKILVGDHATCLLTAWSRFGSVKLTVHSTLA